MEAQNGARQTGAAEGANWTVHGPGLCRGRIATAVRAVLPHGAGPAALCLSIAGYYPPDHQEQARDWAAAAWPGIPVRIETDVLAAWAGAHGGEAGLVLICGTGSICYGRGADGSEARAGGWGPLLGDEGSAYWIGIGALRALARQVDRRDGPSALGGALLQRWPELGDDLRSWLRGVYRQGWGREQVAAVASEVARLAECGDELAVRLIRQAAAELAETAALVEVSLGGSVLPLAVQGGLAAGSALLVQQIGARLRDRGSALSVTPSRFSPLEGAVLLAAEAFGGPDAVARLRALLR